MDRPVLAVLEDAELRARERRLAAAAEAERRLADAAALAAAIEKRVAPTAARAVADARAASDARVAAAIARIEAAMHAIDATTGVDPDDTAIGDAADVIVAAVLGEGPA